MREPSRVTKKNTRQQRRQDRRNDISPHETVIQLKEREPQPLEPITEAQKRYLQSIKNNIITFGIGVAGSGKSYVATMYACELLKQGKISRIFVTRPIVEAGEKLGFLPGLEEEKVAPYFYPIKDIMESSLGKSHVEYLIKHGRIVFKPLAYMRGCTFNDAFLIADEMENATDSQMRLILTRIGKNCKVVIDGDLAQKDISGESGLKSAMEKLKNVNNINVVKFGIEDIVRSDIVKDIIIAYNS